MPSLRGSPTGRHPPGRKPGLLIPKPFLAHAGLGRIVHRYDPKQTIFSQGQRADAVFYIQEGTVRLSVLSKQGKDSKSPRRFIP
jgi:CRP/FNR family transcriptional regulator, cyclic AMP receptor protein